MSVTIPSAGGAVSPARFLVTAAGAGVGIALGSTMVLPKVPSSITGFSFGPLTGTSLVLGACALLGGAVANMIYSKVSGS